MWKLETNLGRYLPDSMCKLINTDTLGMAFEPEQRFENPDGSDIIFDCDINGIKRGSSLIPGPWADKDCEFIY